MSDMLERICADKRAAVAKAKTSRPLGEVEFRAARAPAPPGPGRQNVP